MLQKNHDSEHQKETMGLTANHWFEVPPFHQLVKSSSFKIVSRQVMTDPLLGPPNIPLNYDDAWLVKWYFYVFLTYLDVNLMNTWMNDSCGLMTDFIKKMWVFQVKSHGSAARWWTTIHFIMQFFRSKESR